MVVSKSLPWLLPLLRRIRLMPPMYLRDDRLNSLACHIEGFIDGLQAAGAQDTEDEYFLSGFAGWLRAKCELIVTRKTIAGFTSLYVIKVALVT